MSRKVCVIGNGMTEFSKPGKSPDYHIMAREAGQQALAEAGIGYEEVDQAVVGYVYGDNINVNTIAPVARSRMTETVMPPPLLEKLRPEAVAPLVGWLCSEESKESGSLFEVGAGRFFKLGWQRNGGFATANDDGVASLEELRDNWSDVADMSDAKPVRNIQDSTMEFMKPIKKKS